MPEFVAVPTDEPAIRLLGPLTVDGDSGPVNLGPRQQRVVFGILALEAGRPVRVTQLESAAWFGRQVPASARNAVHVSISRLRAAADGIARIVTVGDGYRLDVDPAQIDVHRYRALVAAARRYQGDDRAETLRRADALWRGPVLAGELPDEARDWLCSGLEAERLAALEDRIDAELALGRHRELLGELTGLVSAHGRRERLVGQLMLALYRSGQAAQALEVGRRLRAALAEELGIDPDLEIRELEVAILRQRPELAGSATATSGGLPPVPAQLPAADGWFVGREVQLGQLDALLMREMPARLVCVTGTAGVGKTALAVAWGQRVRDTFPGGQLYIDMRGYSSAEPIPPVAALTRFLRALGVPAAAHSDDLDDAAALYRSVLADRRVLVVLDNVRDAEQVRPLLPGGPGCLVLVTSRCRLPGLVARDAGHRIELDVLPTDDARAMLRAALGARTDREPSAVDDLVALCARLPLALRTAAATLAGQPHRGVADYVWGLRTGDRLEMLSIDDDPGSALRVSFALSYGALSGPAQRVFRVAGSRPGAPLTVLAASAGTGLPVAMTHRLLRQLVDAHLLDEVRPGRYGMHDLLSLYALECADQEVPVAVPPRAGRDKPTPIAR